MANQLEKMIREKESSPGLEKDSKKSLFEMISDKLFTSREQERMSLVTDMETK